MNIKDFKSGDYHPQFKFKNFYPAKINHNWIWDDPKINTLLSEASFLLGELNAFSLYLPDIDIFIKMHVAKEALTSSRIEGTKTEMSEVFLEEKEINPEKRNDWKEVQNYIRAMNDSIDELKNVPLSTRILLSAHKILLTDVRGQHKTPGEYRRSQNWVGGATINDATFIPPSFEEVEDLMNDLEKFLHNEDINVPHLIKIAIAHYQFETIHPFLDGNGRIGRLLITLYLVSCGLLAKPTLYLSAYFEKYRTLYNDNLMNTRLNNDLGQWLKFFLVAVIETCKKGIATFQQILTLKEKIENENLVKFGRRINQAKEMMNLLYTEPTINSKTVVKKLNVTPATANSLIRKMVELGILQDISETKRNRIFVFMEYILLFSEEYPVIFKH